VKRSLPKPRPRRQSPSLTDTTAEQVASEQRAAEAVQIENCKARKKKKKVSKLALQLQEVETIPQLLELFNITACDYVLVGDGSCTGDWKYQAGWACAVINVITGKRQEIYGGAHLGTNILSEMMAYIYAFHWISRKKTDSVAYIDVFTDCEYVVMAATNPNRRKAYREIWHMVDAYKRCGMIIRWHWIPRDTLNLNCFSHDLANLARVAMKGLNETALSGMDVDSLYELTPSRLPRQEEEGDADEGVE